MDQATDNVGQLAVAQHHLEKERLHAAGESLAAIATALVELLNVNGFSLTVGPDDGDFQDMLFDGLQLCWKLKSKLLAAEHNAVVNLKMAEQEV